MTDRPRSRRRVLSLIRLPRTATAVGLVVFSLIASTGTATALWTTDTASLSSTASAGTLTFTQTGGGGLAKEYSSGNLVDVAPITVTNTGTVPGPVSLRIVAKAANPVSPLSNVTTITAWQVASTAACTATPPVGAQTVSASLAVGVTIAFATTPVGASVISCVRTTIPEAEANKTTAATEINAVLTAALGNWAYSATATVATQSLAPDGVSPTAPTNLIATGTTTTQTTLSWGAATDAFGVTGYRVYRGGVPIATVTGLTYTNFGLVASTPYTYTVRAVDAAGNLSLNSNAITVTTPSPFYRISNVNNPGMCLDAAAGSTAEGTRLDNYTCNNGQNQMWQVVPITGNYVRITARYAPNLVWTVNRDGATGMNDLDKVKLTTYNIGLLNQQWTVEDFGGNKRFVNRFSGKCLDLDAGTNVNGYQLQQYTCNGSVAQSFAWTVTP